jgi:hypothetical protein
MNATFASTKSSVREESDLAIQQFLARGGQIQEVKKRKAPKMVMRGKQSRGYKTGTSGFPSAI